MPVVLLAGAFEPVDEVRVAAVGCAGVLVKPFEPQMVIATVAEPARAATPRRRACRSPAVAERARRAQRRRTCEPADAPDLAIGRDEYFERLDTAFATLNTSLEPRAHARQPLGAATRT